ncbi:MAG: putative porin [Thermodesulfobacteriota bacterium]|nr:putative porin [Thermodesulfobacteriota bacterium]
MIKRVVRVWMMIALIWLCGGGLPGFCEEPTAEPSDILQTDEQTQEYQQTDQPATLETPLPPVSRSRLSSTEALIQLMQEKGLISKQEAEAFLKEYQEAKTDGSVITVIPGRHEDATLEAITEQLSRELQKEVDAVKENVDDTTRDLFQRAREAKNHRDLLEYELRYEVNDQLRKSAWAQRFSWGGDLRMRYQADYFGEENAEFGESDNPSELMNTRNDRHRGRIRARLNAKATVFKPEEINTGKMQAGIRISTGSVNDPVSTNETLGDYDNKDSIVLDRAYLKWAYKPRTMIWGQIPELTIQAGRFGSPFVSTDLIWDSDLGFEGGALSFKTDVQDEFNPFAGFFTIGAYLLQEEAFFQQDKWFYGVQTGVTYEQPFGLNATLAVALYDFKNTIGVKNRLDQVDADGNGIYDWTAPEYQQKGNSLINISPRPGVENYKMALAADYKEMAVTCKLDYGYSYPNHVILTGEYVKNIGFDAVEVSQRTGIDLGDLNEETEGYRIGLSIGNPEVRWFGDWQLYSYYKYLEADAVIDAFTDSDFHLGGTDCKGWLFGVDLGIHRNVWLTTRWLTSDEIKSLPLAVDTLQVDLNAKF